MAQDYARKPRSTSRKKHYEPRVPAWVWLFTGGVLGAFIMFLMHLTRVEDPAESQLPFIGDAIKTSENKSPQVREPLEKPESPFTFPQILRDAEVKVPEGSTQQNPDATPAPVFEYMLQVASFKELKDAEQVRAELILLNMDARVEQATIRDNEQWYRVVVGPFTSRSKLSKARSTLISNNYNAQVRKRSIPG